MITALFRAMQTVQSGDEGEANKRYVCQYVGKQSCVGEVAKYQT